MTISQIIRIAQKKSFMRKMSVRLLPIYPANLATFEESWIFGRSEAHFEQPPKRDMIWYEILRPSFFFTLRIFYVTMATWQKPRNIRLSDRCTPDCCRILGGSAIGRNKIDASNFQTIFENSSLFLDWLA